MCFFQDISNSYKKWGTYSFSVGPHLYVCLWSHTYDGDPHSFSWCHDLIVTWLLDPQHYLSMLSKFFPSSYANCNGVFGSLSSSTRAPSFCSTNVSWFALYFKLTIHTRHHLDHFQTLATSCMRLLPMNIGLLYSSPIDIILGIINGSYSLSNPLATKCPQKLVASCPQNLG